MRVNRSFESGLTEGVVAERRLFHVSFGTHDQREGMHAFFREGPKLQEHKHIFC